MSLILAIETSCDECSASVVEFDSQSSEGGSPNVAVHSLATFSQIELHIPFGGVVPEVASRNHLESINFIIDRAVKEAKIELKDLDAIAVTQNPGLVGALLVGVSAAKAMAFSLKIPLIPVHHLMGHIASLWCVEFKPGWQTAESEVLFPALFAIVSGGHTSLFQIPDLPHTWNKNFLEENLLARTRDDAAGEAFDKTGKLLGFPYPGGVHLDHLAKQGDPKKFLLPRALPQKSVLDFSFSGLKTQSAVLIEKLKKENTFEENKANLCASIQEAIVDAILIKVKLAKEKTHARSVAIVGGVSANSRLRQKLPLELNCPVVFPKLKYSTDNAAMIGAAASFQFQQGRFLKGKEILRLNAASSGAVQL